MITFSPKHYVPIVKWKRAEQRALEALDEKKKDNITPLIELVMPMVPLYKERERNDGKKIKKTQDELFTETVSKFKEKRINQIPGEILRSWGARPVFLDFSLLYEAEFTTQLKVNSLNTIVSVGIDMGLKIIPVINLNDDPKIKKAICSLLGKNSQGICLRIAPSGLSNTEVLNKKVRNFLQDFNLLRKSIDLLIDIKEIKERGGEYLQFTNASQQVENLLEWRNFIFASGAFPEDLSECRRDEVTLLPRFDWQNWLHHSNAKTLTRKPTFADYTIRNPVFKELLQYYYPTTSIKYSLENDWLVMKGRVRELELYLANAKLLVEDTDYFYGENFSWGDKNIAQKAKYFHQYVKNRSAKGTGRTEDWIAWEMNHHLTAVVDQIANLL